MATLLSDWEESTTKEGPKVLLERLIQSRA